MLKRIKIRGKLLLLLAAPLLAVLVFASAGVLDRTEIADSRARNADLAELAQENAELSVAFQVERFQTILSNRLSLPTIEIRPDQVATDEQVVNWNDTVNRTLGDIQSSELAGQITELQLRINDSITADRSVRTNAAGLATELNRISGSLTDLNLALIAESDDLELFRALDLNAEVERIQESLAEITFIGSSAIANGELSPTAASLIDAATASMASGIRNIRTTADPQYVAILDQLQDEGSLPSFVGAAVTRSGPWVPTDQLLGVMDGGMVIGVVEWVGSAEDRFVAVSGLSAAVLSDAQAASVTASNTAADEARSFLILAASVIVFALVLAFVVARSVSRPLSQLTRSAEQLSAEELPAMVESLRTAGRSSMPVLSPIQAKGRDEVAQLSRAFSEIQVVTVEVAEEQGQLLRRGISDIFVNLARRNQSLLDRQIDFIDQLESREENPDALENLFRLDHLATRMRRNAESLLVLAGAEPTRRRGRPVEMSDVVRVAMGEIEDFGRIQLVSIDSATVAGSVAVDLAHLLSELMENATHFSPPDTGVEVVGHRNADGDYQMTLSDSGIGMSAEQLVNANKTLEEPPIIGLDLSRSLGFTVISRLAHRLDVVVRLTSGADGGVTALVTVPSEMVGAAEDAEATPPPVAVVPAAQPPALEVPPAPAFESPAPPPIHASLPTRPDPLGIPNIDQAPPAAAAAREINDLAALPRRKAVPPAAAPATPAASADLFEVFSPSDTPAPPANPGADLFAALDTPASLAPPPPPPAAPPAAAAPPAPAPEGLAPPLPQRSAWQEPVVQQPVVPPPVPAAQPVSPQPVTPVQQRPAAEVGTVDPAVTSAGLIRRTPKQVDVPDSSKFATGDTAVAPTAAPVNRSPEEVRQMLSRYRAGLRKGRTPDSGDSQSNRRS